MTDIQEEEAMVLASSARSRHLLRQTMAMRVGFDQDIPRQAHYFSVLGAAVPVAFVFIHRYLDLISSMLGGERVKYHEATYRDLSIDAVSVDNLFGVAHHFDDKARCLHVLTVDQESQGFATLRRSIVAHKDQIQALDLDMISDFAKAMLDGES